MRCRRCDAVIPTGAKQCNPCGWWVEQYSDPVTDEPPVGKSLASGSSRPAGHYSSPLFIASGSSGTYTHYVRPARRKKKTKTERVLGPEQLALAMIHVKIKDGTCISSPNQPQVRCWRANVEFVRIGGSPKKKDIVIVNSSAFEDHWKSSPLDDHAKNEYLDKVIRYLKALGWRDVPLHARPDGRKGCVLEGHIRIRKYSTVRLVD